MSRDWIVNATFWCGEIERAQRRTINGELMPVANDGMVEPRVKGQLGEPGRLRVMHLGDVVYLGEV